MGKFKYYFFFSQLYNPLKHLVFSWSKGDPWTSYNRTILECKRPQSRPTVSETILQQHPDTSNSKFFYHLPRLFSISKIYHNFVPSGRHYANSLPTRS